MIRCSAARYALVTFAGLLLGCGDAAVDGTPPSLANSFAARTETAIEPPREVGIASVPFESFAEGPVTPPPANRSASRNPFITSLRDEPSPRSVPKPFELPTEVAAGAMPSTMPTGDVQPNGAGAVIRIFYGTNRKPTGADLASEPNDAYGYKLGNLDLGVCAVSLPPNHSYGEIERPSVWRFEFRERADQHVMLRQIARVDRGQFARSLQSVTDASASKEAFVFVHGYNNDFAEAARRTAQIKHDLNFDGPAVMFSWPSRGTAAGYSKDREKIAPTLPVLTDFLAMVAEESGARNVHVIAHSMGNEFVTRALTRLSTSRQAHLFDQLILAAPDVDRAEFATMIAPYLRPACRRCTIYAADHDLALAGSHRFHRAPRLGQAGRFLVSFPSADYIDVVDASGIDFDLFNFGHADFSNELLADIRGVMAGLTPPRRRLQPHQVNAAWRFVPGEILTGSEIAEQTGDDPSNPVRPVSFEPKAVVTPQPDEPSSEEKRDDVDQSFWARFGNWWNG